MSELLSKDNQERVVMETVSFFEIRRREDSRVTDELLRPFILMHPKIFPDGNQWCVLYGENLQEGVCGFGDTPYLAAEDFDKNWMWQKLPSPPSPKSTEKEGK
jgi:hypothetical protein